MCGNPNCNRNCSNRCETVCDPCLKQPKLHYCGADINCVGVKRGEELSGAVKKIGDKVCQIVNEASPYTYVNIENASDVDCPSGGITIQVLQVGTDNIVSEHTICNPTEFTATANIMCGVDMVVEEGDGLQEALNRIVAYFCGQL